MLTMKDLAAFAAAERQIQMLPEAEGHEAVPTPEPLPDDIESLAQHDHGTVGEPGEGECDEPYLVVAKRCWGDDMLLCRRHALQLLPLMLTEVAKRAMNDSQRMAECPDCHEPAVDCWTPRPLTPEERADLA